MLTWNRLPVTSPAKLGLFEISRELQFRVCNHSELQASPPVTREGLHFHFSLSCIGEGNGNPLQGSCLENPREGGAWWAAVYGVAQSWTRLKWLSSSSSSSSYWVYKSYLPQWQILSHTFFYITFRSAMRERYYYLFYRWWNRVPKL